MVCLPLLGPLCFSFVYVVLVVPQNRLKYLKPGLLPVLPGSIVDYTKVVYTHLAGAVGLKGLLKTKIAIFTMNQGGNGPHTGCSVRRIGGMVAGLGSLIAIGAEMSTTLLLLKCESSSGFHGHTYEPGSRNIAMRPTSRSSSFLSCSAGQILFLTGVFCIHGSIPSWLVRQTCFRQPLGG